MENESYEKGIATLHRLMGGTRGLEEMGEVAPELSRLAIEAVGDIYNNDALDTRTRELATVAALTALANARPQLKAHIFGALSAGCTRGEIVAVITQMYAYAGFPAALNGMDAAREVFEEIGDTEFQAGR
jgi:4-carboxymuconolactone decarboxylase